MELDEETKQRIFQQVMDIFIIPEIKKRNEKTPFILSGAQVIFSLIDGKNTVRLNSEIKAIATAKLNASKIKGEPIYNHEIENIENIVLTEEDKNSAHITFVLIKDKWFFSFDFRYNKDLAKEHIKASEEFYESAKNNLENNRLRPFFEDAFASAELSAKSILLLLPDKEILKEKGHLAHKNRVEKFSKWAELGNVKVDYSTTLSKLKELRNSARYLSSKEYENEDGDSILKTIGEMIEFSKRSIE